MALNTTFAARGSVLRGASPFRGRHRHRGNLSRLRRALGITHCAGPAAILSQIANNAVHRVEIGGVPDESAILPRHDQTSARQFLEVKRQRSGRYSEPLRYLARGQSFRSVFDEKSVDRQPRFLGQRGKGDEYARRFHDSQTIRTS